MKRIGIGTLALAGIVRCTATSASLAALASALERGGPSAFEAEFEAHGVSLQARVAGTTRVESPEAISLALADCPILCKALRKLACEADRNEVSLCGLCLLNRDDPLRDLDLVFYKLDKVAELKTDYHRLDLGGGTWEGVLYHTPPALEQLIVVRQLVLNWAIPTSDKYESGVYVQIGSGIIASELSEAHKRLLDPDDDVFEIRLEFEHPLTIEYGSPYTGAKLWLYEESSEVLLSQHCAWSGDIEVDIQNFLAYRRLICTLAISLNARLFAWGEHADTWPTEETLDSGMLFDKAAMWSLFIENLEPALHDKSIVLPWRPYFNRCFESRSQIVESVSPLLGRY